MRDGMNKLTMFFFMLSGALLFASSTGMAADAQHGEDLAGRWCAGCHVVATNHQTAIEAPPFAAIANRPDFDANRVAFFLLDPHPKMPNMSLTRTEAADLAAYIGSLTE